MVIESAKAVDTKNVFFIVLGFVVFVNKDVDGVPSRQSSFVVLVVDDDDDGDDDGDVV